MKRTLTVFLSAVLMLGMLALVTGCSGGSSQSSSGTAPSSKSSSSGPTNNPHENMTVSDIEIVETGLSAPKVTCVITNNTSFTYKNTSLSIEGTFTVRDEYGDAKTDTENLDMFVTTCAPLYVTPGANQVEFIPNDQNNIVASYRGNKGDTQNLTLADCEKIAITVREGTPLDEQEVAILNPDEYEMAISMAMDGGHPVVSAEITNKTGYKWKEVDVKLVAVTKDGSFSRIDKNSSNKVAFNVGALKATYMKPGTTEKTDSQGYDSSLNVDHFEIAYVYVTKDVD